jgi:hypothetical protein
MDVVMATQMMDQMDLIIDHFEVVVLKLVLFFLGMYHLYRYAMSFIGPPRKEV